MPVQLNATGDFAQVTDGLESVTLRRRDTAATVAVSAARRNEVVTGEAEPSGGSAHQSDAVWHLQLPTGEGPPELGDVVIDGAGQRWTTLQVVSLLMAGRFKCVTRELSVAFGCVNRVDIQRAVWGDLGSGPVIVDWDYAYTALPAKIQPESIVVDETVTPTATNSLFQIVLGEQISLEPDDRFVAEDGSIYTLLSLEQAERIDALPIAKVRREPAA